MFINKSDFDDPEFMNSFIKNVEKQFRSTDFYTAYKAYLINEIGMDFDQIQTNIKAENATLEMHHSIINLYEITLMIIKSFLIEDKNFTSFTIVKELIDAHLDNIVPITMITVSNHQKFHKSELKIPHFLIFGDYMKLIEKYKQGATFSIFNKILKFLEDNKNEDATGELIRSNERLLKIYNEMYNGFNAFVNTQKMCRFKTTNLY